MDLMTIGEFAARTRLSPKALRLYDRLGLLTPALTDPASGYRHYRPDQVRTARLIGQLRRVDMPLAVIAGLVAKPPREAADAVGAYWAVVESVTAERRALVSYVQATLMGEAMTSYDIKTRAVPARTVVSVSRHLHASETDAFFADAFARLRAAGPGIEGIDGCPFVIFYGEVSDDSDGPVELCRPVAGDLAAGAAAPADGLQARTEPAHDEAYIRVALQDVAWPALAPALDALESWVRVSGRQPISGPRQVMFADLRTAKPADPVCDLAVPLR
jgi:DNA-binding transcriptional MerR regulator